jgi:glycosyltransferase involved in cell wall biosynthesis
VKFSILTPSFNQAAFLEKNIQSVLNQDVEGTQHIVMDGGSTDGSADILRRYDDKLYHWVSKKDKGQTDALCKGMAKATNEIVGWSNSDEYYEPNVFGLVRDAFEKNPRAVLVYGDFRRVTPDGQEIRINRQYRFDYDVARIYSPIFANCAAFFRRDRMLEVGGFDASWDYIMDWEFYIRFMRGGQQWVRLPRILGNFTMHPMSKTAIAHDFSAAGTKKSSFQERFAQEMKRLHEREFPGASEEQLRTMRRKQMRRAMWMMARDGVLMEKIWFKVFRQRHYAKYFGETDERVPVVSKLLDWISPVKQ